MSYQDVIERALRQAQDVLWDNLPPWGNHPNDRTIDRLRAIIRAPDVRSALDRGSDAFPAFALQAVRTILADGRRRNREAIDALWPVLDDPMLNAALSTSPSARMQLRWASGDGTRAQR